MSWQDKIRNADCEDCGLHEHAQHVCLMGSGRRSSRLFVVGEAPGAREDDEHTAFVGPAGLLLTELLDDIGLQRSEIYISNAVKCRPKDNATPTRTEVKACSQYLIRELEEVQPEYVLALGNTALQAITGRSGITKYRGRVHDIGSFKVLATFHPAAALRNPKYLPSIKADFQALKAYLSGTQMGNLQTAVRIIKTPAQLRWLVNKLKEAEVIAFDLETTGLDEHAEGAKIVTIGVAWEVGHAAVVPIHHASGDSLGQPALDALKCVLERTDARYVAHNAKFDSRWLARFGIYVPVTSDTMLAHHLLDENSPHGLKPLSQLYLGALDYDIGDDVKRAFEVPLKKLCIYNGKDCDYTLRLYFRFRELLIQEPRLARLYTKLTIPASRVLTKVEAGGIYVDLPRLQSRTEEATYKITKCVNYMNQYLPKGVATINYNSPQQVGNWLFGHLKLPIIEQTATGNPSTREAVLLQLAKRHKAVDVLLRYRKWAKYLSTYISSWSEQVDDRSRLHTSYLLHGTVTGRLSSRGPNLQQVPRDPFIRSILGAPPGWLFVEADYSQVELRLAAWIAGERTMLRILAAGEDLHTNTATSITGLLPSAFNHDTRVVWGKHPNFGLVYGMSPGGYVRYCAENGIEVTEGESQDVYRRFHETYPGLRRWHDRQRRLVSRYERVSSAIGRVRHLPDIRSHDPGVRAEAERQAINSPVQSLASDLMLFSLVRLSTSLDPRVARIVGSVHDSLLFEVREGEVQQVAKVIKYTMEDMSQVKRVFGADITVPIEAEVQAGTHWGEGRVVA